MRQYLEKLSMYESLSASEMNEAASALLAEETADSEVAAFLMALKLKGETAEEIACLAEVLRSQAVNITVPDEYRLMDNCGTGGDGSCSFNISTAAAFVIAGTGIKVAKHGNRSISSRTGSADVLEELGIQLFAEPGRIEEMLAEAGIGFLFAPSVQPRLGRISKIRKELKIPTVFNLLGPLTNPAPLHSQLVGVYREDLLGLFGAVLDKLGRRRAICVHGAGGMDEASLQGKNELVLLEDGKLTPFSLTPEQVGLPSYKNEEIRGGDARENAAIMLRILRGEKGAGRDTVLLNAGLAIFANGKAKTIIEGIRLAEESIDSGNACGCLERLITYCQKTKAVI